MRLSDREIWKRLNSSGASPCTRLVLAALYDYWNPVTGQCSPTVETLAKKTNVSTGTIKRSLSRLREAGVIRQKRGPRRINSYTIAPPEEWALRLAGSVRVAR